MFNYAIQILHEKRIELIDLSLKVDDTELREQIAELEKAMWSLSMVFELTDEQIKASNLFEKPFYELMIESEKFDYKTNITRKKRGWNAN